MKSLRDPAASEYKPNSATPRVGISRTLAKKYRPKAHLVPFYGLTTKIFDEKCELLG